MDKDPTEETYDDFLRNKETLNLSVLINIMSFLMIITAIIISADKNDPYLQLGPNGDLFVLGIKIDSWPKYFLLQVFLYIIELSNTYNSEFSDPILVFNIYNPDKKEINYFTRTELQTYANVIWTINSVKNILMVVVSISQIDIAILKVLYSQTSTFYTIRVLLLAKNFPKEKATKPVFYSLFSSGKSSSGKSNISDEYTTIKGDAYEEYQSIV